MKKLVAIYMITASSFLHAQTYDSSTLVDTNNNSTSTSTVTITNTNNNTNNTTVNSTATNNNINTNTSTSTNSNNFTFDEQSVSNEETNSTQNITQTQSNNTNRVEIVNEDKKETTQTVKKNVQDNEAAGEVSIDSLAQTPIDFNAYLNQQMKDMAFYAPKEIYKGQKNVDNARLLRGLTGGSDSLHQEMVNQQYGQ